MQSGWDGVKSKSRGTERDSAMGGGGFRGAGWSESDYRSLQPVWLLASSEWLCMAETTENYKEVRENFSPSPRTQRHLVERSDVS